MGNSDNNGELIEQLRLLRARVAHLEAEAAAVRTLSHQHVEDTFRTLADAAPVMLWMSGQDGLCTFFNKRWLAFRGRSIQEEIGNGWVEGVHPDDRAACMDTYLGAFHARREFQMEYRLQRHDGEYRWIIDSGVPRFQPGGAFTGYMGSGIDIHEAKLFAAAPGPLPLTEREKQVLVLISEGKSTKEVAALLGISYKTADSHRSKIMEKLDIHETATLVRYAIRNRLVKP